MACLKVQDDGTIITRFVSMSESQDCSLTIQTALDGTEYLTRFGKPITHYTLTLYVDEGGKERLQKAADTLSLLEFSVRKGTFAGRVSKLSAFKYLAAGWYEVTATLSAQSEVEIA